MAEIPLRADSVRFNPTVPADRKLVEGIIEQLVSLLDEIDGDSDLEDGDQDCCAAYDDRAGQSLTGLSWAHAGPGDIEDAEDDLEDVCEAHDDGCGPVFLHGHMHWGSAHDEYGVLC